MTIQQCKYILAIARLGSMNEAAKALLVSQASLSSAVRELENEFGIHIFDRSNKGVRITREGSEFIRYARQLLAQYEIITDRYERDDKKTVRNFAVTSQQTAQRMAKWLFRDVMRPSLDSRLISAESALRSTQR